MDSKKESIMGKSPFLPVRDTKIVAYYPCFYNTVQEILMKSKSTDQNPLRRIAVHNKDNEARRGKAAVCFKKRKRGRYVGNPQ